MATVTAFIRPSTKKVDKAYIRFRLRDGRNIQLFHKSEYDVKPDEWNYFWDQEKQIVKAKVIFNERDAFNDKISIRKKLLLAIYNAESNKAELTSELFEQRIDVALHPTKYEKIEQVKLSFFDTFTEFLKKHKLSEGRKRHFNVVIRALKRYELYTSKTTNKPFNFLMNKIYFVVC